MLCCYINLGFLITFQYFGNRLKNLEVFYTLFIYLDIQCTLHWFRQAYIVYIFIKFGLKQIINDKTDDFFWGGFHKIQSFLSSIVICMFRKLEMI